MNLINENYEIIKVKKSQMILKEKHKSLLKETKSQVPTNHLLRFLNKPNENKTQVPTNEG
jgi:hypothetical protein